MRPVRFLEAIRVGVELTKARLSLLVLFTTAVGFVLASAGADIELRLLAWTLAGTGLTAAGCMVLNQRIEIRRDGLMERTRARPLPAGRIAPAYATIIGVSLSAIGVVVLWWLINPLTAMLGFANVLLYTLVYTPLKPISSLCTVIGAICGAIPPVMGWTAAAEAAPGMLLLAGLLFIWQIPHFLALAWIYRDDYARGGFKMLPVIDPTGRITFRLVLLYSAALVPAGAVIALVGQAGAGYGVGAAVLGGCFFVLAARLFLERTRLAARRVFLGSIVYLASLMALMLVDRAAAGGGGELRADLIENRTLR